eukprot:352945-Chlamydomonas_euryale.AAC.6
MLSWVLLGHIGSPGCSWVTSAHTTQGKLQAGNAYCLAARTVVQSPQACEVQCVTASPAVQSPQACKGRYIAAVCPGNTEVSVCAPVCDVLHARPAATAGAPVRPPRCAHRLQT